MPLFYPTWLKRFEVHQYLILSGKNVHVLPLVVKKVKILLSNIWDSTSFLKNCLKKNMFVCFRKTKITKVFFLKPKEINTPHYHD